MNRSGPPPTRFVEAEKINPYQVLVDLHDQAIGRPFPPTRNDALGELALAAAAVSWWARSLRYVAATRARDALVVVGRS